MNVFTMDLVCPVCGNKETFEVDTVPNNFLLLNSNFHAIRDNQKLEEVKIWICRECSSVIGSHSWLLKTKSQDKDDGHN